MSKKSEEALNALIKPIRKWLAGDKHRNALVILSEPISNHCRTIPEILS